MKFRGHWSIPALLIREYRRLRRLGWQGLQALQAARTNLAWEDAEAEGLVRFRCEPDECYQDDTDRYQGLRPSLRKRYEREDAETIEREGVWCYFAEWLRDDVWETADSIGGCVGTIADGGYDVDLKASALAALASHEALSNPGIWGATCNDSEKMS